MAHSKQLSWTQLRVGLFVLAGTILLVATIFYVTGRGGALGPKYRLHLLLSEVDGLTVGAPVRVDGVDVGNVEKIAIAPQQLGQPIMKKRSVEVVLRVQKSFENYIRSDSTAALITEGLLGNRYVDIDRGFVGRVLQNDEEISGRPEQGLKEAVQRSADLMQNLNAITDQARQVLTDVRNGKGSLGKFLVDEEAYNHLNRSLGNVDRLMADVEAGKGTLGQLVTNDEMYNRVNSVAARVDTVLEAVQSKQGTLGKLVYESDIHDSAKTFIDHGNTFLSNLQAGQGTLGKLVTDDSLFTQYKQVGENLSSATAKMNSNQTTVGKFFTDPKLYDNLAELTGDMRLLVGDFRKNPKKFLRVNFKIF